MLRHRLVILAVACLTGTGCQNALFRVEGKPPADPDFLLRHFTGCLDHCGPTVPAPPPAITIDQVSTVISPELPRRPLSLAECIALALENGRTGTFFDRSSSDRRTSVTGLARLAAPGAATDSIRVLALDPAVLGTEVEQSLSKFDAIWQSSMIWDHINEPSRSLITDPTGLVNLTLRNQLDNVDFRTGVLKPLPTGGVAGITFRSNYTYNVLPPGAQFLNPAYQTFTEVTFEQPLLRGAGVFINQLRDTHPGSIRNPFPTGGRVPGILLARIAQDQAQQEFLRRVHELLFAVEEAYWDLYCAYWELYSRDVGMKLTHSAWQLVKPRYEAGGITIAELTQVESQYHSFRAQRLEALGNGTPGRPGVLEAERRLRYLTGLPPEDGCRLMPCDAPVTTPLEPGWKPALADALANRPELVQIRQDVEAARLAVRRAEDFLQPDLRFLSRYNLNGLASNLPGSFRSLGTGQFHDWEMGLQMFVPVGYREAHSEVMRAKLQLAQRLAFLNDQEGKTVLSLQRSYRELVQFREEVQVRQAQKQAATLQVRSRAERLRAGDLNPVAAVDLLLRALITWADAVRDEQIAVCRYNVALADFERQKGTIMRYDNVNIAEGPLPVCAGKRASEHIREFNRSLPVSRPAAAVVADTAAPLAALPPHSAENDARKSSNALRRWCSCFSRVLICSCSFSISVSCWSNFCK